jgi:hypothetical protein
VAQMLAMGLGLAGFRRDEILNDMRLTRHAQVKRKTSEVSEDFRSLCLPFP